MTKASTPPEVEIRARVDRLRELLAELGTLQVEGSIYEGMAACISSGSRSIAHTLEFGDALAMTETINALPDLLSALTPQDDVVEKADAFEALNELRRCECPDKGVTCRNCRAYLKVLAALEPERRQIVEWLRGNVPTDYTDPQFDIGINLADAIERGEHLEAIRVGGGM